jgi:catechol 2,3-dioxygenase-like lactoylglutathione lyase family enzyme
MDIKFTGPVIFVEDMKVARQFYEGVLGQTVVMDLGLNVAYTGGLALWQRAHANQIVFGKEPAGPRPLTHPEAELVFETRDLDEAAARLDAAGVQYAHRMTEMPWAQRVIRFYDPDGHLCEIGEPMDVVVLRYLSQGMNAEDVAQRTFMPLEIVQQIAAARG